MSRIKLVTCFVWFFPVYFAYFIQLLFRLQAADGRILFEDQQHVLLSARENHTCIQTDKPIYKPNDIGFAFHEEITRFQYAFELCRMR